MLDRRHLLLSAAGLTLAACATCSTSASARPLLVDLDRQPDVIFPLWPAGAPGGQGVALTEHYVERDNRFGLRDRAAHEVTSPTLSLFRAAQPSGASILIIPGGGYSWVVVEKEGYEGARYFNQFGYDVYVLKYRLPHQGWAAGPDTPLQDAQRAMRVIRARAAEDRIDPARIMVMGFSAGGHLAGLLCQRFDVPVYAEVDSTDTLPARPDLGVLVYPVALMSAPFEHPGSRRNLIGDAPGPALRAQYDLTTAPNPTGPNLFLLHALDDEAVPVENALFLAAACRRVGVSAVLHTFAAGGHGFGLRGIDGQPVALWPRLVLDWAADLTT